MELKVKQFCCSKFPSSLFFRLRLLLVIPIVVPMTSLARARSLGGLRGGRGAGEVALVRTRCSASPVRGWTR